MSRAFVNSIARISLRVNVCVGVEHSGQCPLFRAEMLQEVATGVDGKLRSIYPMLTVTRAAPDTRLLYGWDWRARGTAWRTGRLPGPSSESW